MNKPLILVVEDDAAVKNLITTTLETHQYRFRTASTGETAVMEAVSHNPDVILLDLGLPDMDGIDIIRKIRSWSKTPIIVLSARSEDTDKIDALARLRVTFRRLNDAGDSAAAPASVFTNGEMRLDYAAGTVTMSGQELHLTPIEYKLLCLLAKNVGKVLTHTYITKKIWGSAWDNDVASLRVFMATLRKKIEPDPSNPQYIQTHIGVGYRMLKV